MTSALTLQTKLLFFLTAELKQNMSYKKHSGSYEAEKPKGSKQGLHGEIQKTFEEGDILIDNDATGVREVAQQLIIC